ncbi:glycosyltransferase family 2 protein [Neobacillus bataviensis]|nr:glycosyltransferase family 2 protein [Neobacillus bataviensis]
MKKAQILLSTYNGEKFVEQQLDSLMNQDHKNLEVLIRDDGSKDNTIQILETYSKQYPNIKLIKGANKGVIASFFELALNASDTSDFFAFCDQDDYWRPTKVSRAIALLEKEDANIPLLYFSRLDIVDDKLQFIKHSQIPPQEVGLKNAIIQNVATGCTIVFNRAMLELFKSHIPAKENITMHDAWFYLLGAAFGKLIYDKESHLLYRQHSSNALGMADNKVKSAMIRYKNFKKEGKEKPFTKQVDEFYRLFKGDLTSDQRKLIEDFLLKRNSLLNRFSYILNTPLYRQNQRDTIIFKILYSFNSY